MQLHIFFFLIRQLVDFQWTYNVLVSNGDLQQIGSQWKGPRVGAPFSLIGY